MTKFPTEPRLIAILPPEYLPRLDVCGLASAVDGLILGDLFQYSRQSYQNRARIRTPQGRMWLSVPLVGGQAGTPIKQAQIASGTSWQRHHLQAIQFNYGTSPFYFHYEPELRELVGRKYERLADLTVASWHLLLKSLRVGTPVVCTSELPGSPAGFDAVRALFPRSDVLALPRLQSPTAPPLRIWTFEERPYRQSFNGFEEGLSALDLLMNYGPEAPAVLQNGMQRTQS